MELEVEGRGDPRVWVLLEGQLDVESLSEKRAEPKKTTVSSTRSRRKRASGSWYSARMRRIRASGESRKSGSR
jgi:hypothetical protein